MDEKTFFKLLQPYFPRIYDIKYMTSLCDRHSGEFAMSSYVALATSKFTKNGAIDDTRDSNEVYGYGTNYTVRKGPILSAHGKFNSVISSMNGDSDSVH